MDLARIFRKPKLLRTLTTLDAGEFKRLAAALEAAWQGQRAARTFDGQERRRKAGGAGTRPSWPAGMEKLFFLLFYFKCYPLQEVMGTFFGLSQGQVSHWVGVLIRDAGKPDAVEVAVEADLSSHGLPMLVGVLDLVQDQRIIDFKTSGSTPNADRAALVNGTQATAYSILYRENTGRKETGVELHHLVKLKQPKLVVIYLSPVGDRECARLFRIIDAYVEGLERRDFIPSPGLQCASCEFFHECAAWH